MKKEIKTERFNQWISSEPLPTYEEKRKRIVTELCGNRTVYCNWKSGRTEIPNMAIEKLEEITGFPFRLSVNTQTNKILSTNRKQATIIADKLCTSGINVNEVRFVLNLDKELHFNEALLILEKPTKYTTEEINDLLNN